MELACGSQWDKSLSEKLQRLGKRSRKDLVADRYGVKITVEKLKCLLGTEWLNSEVITFWLEWWGEQIGAGAAPISGPQGAGLGSVLNHGLTQATAADHAGEHEGAAGQVARLPLLAGLPFRLACRQGEAQSPQLVQQLLVLLVGSYVLSVRHRSCKTRRWHKLIQMTDFSSVLD